MAASSGSYSLLLLAAPHDGVAPSALLAVRDGRRRVVSQVCCMVLWWGVYVSAVWSSS